MNQNNAAAINPMVWWAAILHILAAIFLMLICLVGINKITGNFLLSVLATPLALIPITLLLRIRKETWADLGFHKPQSWSKTLVQGVVIAVVALLVMLVLQYLLDPYFLKPDKSLLDELRGNLWLYLYFVGIVSWLGQGLGEELLFRGFIMTRLAQMFRLNRNAWVAAVIIQGVLFGLIHGYQGIAGMIASAGAGMVFGIGYLVAGKNLLPSMIAHTLCGIVLSTMLYLGLS